MFPGGEGNGNPLQYSCLEKPVYGGAWWAAVHRVAQGRTRLKRLSSRSMFPGHSVLLVGRPERQRVSLLRATLCLHSFSVPRPCECLEQKGPCLSPSSSQPRVQCLAHTRFPRNAACMKEWVTGEKWAMSADIMGLVGTEDYRDNQVTITRHLGVT